MTAARNSTSGGGRVSTEKFYDALIETNNKISSLELNLTNQINELRVALPSCDDIDSAKKLAKEALDRANAVDNKTNWFSGINAALATIMAGLAAFIGSK